MYSQTRMSRVMYSEDLQYKVHQENAILVLIRCQDKWMLEERPLLSNYEEDCELLES